MSEFPEEIPGQIAAGVKRLGSRGYTHYSIYPIGPDVPYDEFPLPAEWIQTTGIAPDRLTVEIKQPDSAGVHRLYTIGRQPAAGENAETEVIYNGDNEYRVRPAEVLTTADAIELFQHYYDTRSVPADWHLREQPEFSDTAVEEHLNDQTATGDRTTSRGRAPIEEKGTSAAKSRRKPETGK